VAVAERKERETDERSGDETFRAKANAKARQTSYKVTHEFAREEGMDKPRRNQPALTVFKWHIINIRKERDFHDQEIKTPSAPSSRAAYHI
jgi:hypothetical protein